MSDQIQLDTIFILGIKRRSGTNWLSDLICQHPSCTANTIKEDYALAHAGHLIDYADQYYNSFPRLFRVKASQKSLLYESLGAGVRRYFRENMLNTSKAFRSALNGNRTPHIVTKTPSVQNLECFPKLFPKSPLVIIVRDGRDVVESNVRSFEFTYRDEMIDWANAAQTILSFADSMEDSCHPHMIVRYEELFRNTREKISEILEFLKLEYKEYDFSMIDEMPVRGSSELKKKGRLHWKPVKKSSDFNPIGRWKSWSSELIAEFDRIGGDQLRALGY